MACSSCAARAAMINGRYASKKAQLPQSRSMATPDVEDYPEIICIYTREDLELKLDELQNLRKIQSSKVKRIKITESILIVKDTIKHYDNNCLKNITKLYEIFKH